MNKYILVLKGTNKKLACYEFETLFSTYFNEKIKLKQLKNTFFYLETKNQINNKEFLNRLTYTNYIGKIIFEGKFEQLEKQVNDSKIDFKKVNNKTFSIISKRLETSFQIPIPPSKLAKPIFDSLKKPKVKLENPNYEYLFLFKNKENFYLCEKIIRNDKDYLRRMPKKRPKVMPYTLKSDIARACINLTKLKEGIVLDPFCGQGGILLEAQDMNFNILANDISWNDLKYLKENFKYFFPKEKSKRILADSKNQFLKENSIDTIVSDIPYGKASKKLGKDLYENFLRSSKKYLKKTIE